MEEDKKPQSGPNAGNSGNRKRKPNPNRNNRRGRNGPANKRQERSSDTKTDGNNANSMDIDKPLSNPRNGNNGNTSNGNRNGNNNNINSGRNQNNKNRNNRGRNNNRNRNNNNRNNNNESEKKEVEPKPEPMEEFKSGNETPAADSGHSKVHITNKRFADLEEVCEESRRAMAEVFKYEFMTEVQAQTLPVILDSSHKIDVLAKAKTGTGKTLGFLIPAIEKITQSIKTKQTNKNDVGCLVISPTRELAYQIGAEAEKLVTFHNRPRLAVTTSVGGTNINKDRNVIKKPFLNILIATPGRLLDHLQNADLNLQDRLSKMDCLVLDEADQLLDMGFRPDIERILKLLKPSEGSRQTLLFSATVPKSVSEIAHIALQPKYEFIDTVGEEEEQTHSHVKQEVMVAPTTNESTGMGEKQIRAIAAILDREIKTGAPCKVIAFFTTARLTGFMAEFFNSVMGQTGFPKILEIHSRMSQSVRQRTSEKFRASKDNTILFSSDVSARGMDYPGVTFVLQVGLTERAQYIHRLGRTARAGKGGRGALLLAPYEQKHMTIKMLSDMPLESVDVPELTENLDQAMAKALAGVNDNKRLKESAEQAYRAWLGYYNGNLKKVGWNKNVLVKEANQWAIDVGLKSQPALLRKTVGKMGLKGVSGLKLE